VNEFQEFGKVFIPVFNGIKLMKIDEEKQELGIQLKIK